MAIKTALFITGGGGTPNFSGEQDRTWIAALFGGRQFETLTAGTGARGRGHGVLSGDSMVVSQSGAGAQGVLITTGMAAVRGTSDNNQGVYICGVDATHNLAISAKSATTGQNRRDLVVVRVRDNEFGTAGDDWQPQVIAGATSGSPVDPAVTEDTLVLARVAVNGGAGSTTILTANITDLRVHARCSGCITPVATTSDFPNPQVYDTVWDISATALKMYSGSTWFSIALDMSANWTNYTPTFGGFTLGNGSVHGRYRKLGKFVLFEAGFIMGTTSSVTGALTVTLPGGNAFNGGADYLAIGRGTPGGARWGCIGALDPANDATRYVNFATAGSNPWTIGVPATWTANSTSTFRCFGAYESV